MPKIGDESEAKIVSRETTAEALAKFGELLRKWNPAINLVSQSSLASLETRHVVDSLQLLSLVPPKIDRWVDLGSGGGFPGIVVAIGLAESCASTEVHLIEADLRKATFLREAARQLGLNVTVHAKRVDKVHPMQADVVSARALAPLSQLCGFAVRHMRADGLGVFPKGATFRSEIDQAMESWIFDWEAVPSKTEPYAAVLLLRNIRHVA